MDGSAECLNLARDPVCDVDNQEYGNSCLLAHHNAKLAYRGPCLKRCRHKGQVSIITFVELLCKFEKSKLYRL